MSEQQETWAALEVIRKEFTVIDVFVNLKGEYDDALKALWTGMEDLLIVEQDIVPSLELVREVAMCKSELCACKYTVSYKDDVLKPYFLAYGFGFTKYSAKVQRDFPVESWFHMGDWDWFNLDSRVNGVLVAKGLAHHGHGEVKHNRVVDYFRIEGTGVAMVGV